MQEVFENIVEKLKTDSSVKLYGSKNSENYLIPVDKAIEIVKQSAENYNNGWIPCSERLPEVETEVLIHARRKYTGGHFKDIITTAMYEDGTVREVDSCWIWEYVDGEWDEEEDCLIIPEGWWENKHYNGDNEFNHEVDDKVIEWMPLPELYKESEG